MCAAIADLRGSVDTRATPYSRSHRSCEVPNAPRRVRSHTRSGSIDTSSAAIRALSEFSAIAAFEPSFPTSSGLSEHGGSPNLVPIAWAPADSPLIEHAAAFSRRTSLPIRRGRHNHTSSIGSTSTGARSSIQSITSASSGSTCPSTPGLDSPCSSIASSLWSPSTGLGTPFTSSKPRWSAPRAPSMFANRGIGLGTFMGEEDDECEMLESPTQARVVLDQVSIVGPTDVEDEDSAHDRLGAMMLQSPTLSDGGYTSPLHTPLVGLDAPFVHERKSSIGSSSGARTPHPPRVDSLPTRGLFG